MTKEYPLLLINQTKVQAIESANGQLVENQIQEGKNANLEDGIRQNPLERVGTNSK
jgi:hypothetical protein